MYWCHYSKKIVQLKDEELSTLGTQRGSEAVLSNGDGWLSPLLITNLRVTALQEESQPKKRKLTQANEDKRHLKKLRIN